jgi:microsomal dipeptidase-like Zn-dependent dipeptidase
MAAVRSTARTAATALLSTGALTVAAGAGLRWYAARQAQLRNGVALAPPYPVPAAARAVHQQLQVVDLHADPLLWRRDLLRRSTSGHLDLPRLQAGNVALQVFASVTQVPVGLNFERNEPRGDLVTALAIAQGWPPRTWTSRLERARYAARRLHRFAERSGGALQQIRTSADLDEVLTRRRDGDQVVGALLAIEGSQALDGRLDNLDLLFEADFRMIGLQHFFDNEAGGSAHGTSHGGLTPFGQRLVRRVQDGGMLVDVAHSSPAVVSDVLRVASAPVVVSHTGLRGTCDNERNLSDEHARGVAATGGVIGIALFEHAVGGSTVDDTARAMRYGADLVGVEHIGLGSDFDGAITTSVDATGLPLLTASLLRHGFTEPEVAAIMGGNALRVLRACLPAAG